MEYRKIGLLSKDWIPPKLSPEFFWVACFLISAIVTTALAGEQDLREFWRFVMLCGVLSLAGFLLTPYALHFCSRNFLDWARSVDGFIKADKQDDLVQWYNAELGFFEGTWAMLAAALAFATIATLAYSEGGFKGQLTPPAWIWAECLVFASAFMGGCGLWAIACGGVAIWRLGETFKDRVTVTPGRFGVLSTGRMLAWCWIVIGVVWFMYTLSSLFGPPREELADLLFSQPVVVLAWPTLPFICGAFILCQVPLHKGMMAYKRREIRRLELWLDRLMSRDLATLDKEGREEIEFLRRRWSELDRLPEWPFNLVSAAGVGGSTLMSVMPVVVKVGEMAAKPVKQLMV